MNEEEIPGRNCYCICSPLEICSHLSQTRLEGLVREANREANKGLSEGHWEAGCVGMLFGVSVSVARSLATAARIDGKKSLQAAAGRAVAPRG